MPTTTTTNTLPKYEALQLRLSCAVLQAAVLDPEGEAGYARQFVLEALATADESTVVDTIVELIQQVSLATPATLDVRDSELVDWDGLL